MIILKALVKRMAKKKIRSVRLFVRGMRRGSDLTLSGRTAVVRRYIVRSSDAVHALRCDFGSAGDDMQAALRTRDGRLDRRVVN